MNNQPADLIEEAQRALGRALRELRKQAGVTQKELGAKAGAPDTYISQVEKGQRDIRWSTVTRLLVALDMTLADLTVAIERQAETTQG